MTMCLELDLFNAPRLRFVGRLQSSTCISCCPLAVKTLPMYVLDKTPIRTTEMHADANGAFPDHAVLGWLQIAAESPTLSGAACMQGSTDLRDDRL